MESLLKDIESELRRWHDDARHEAVRLFGEAQPGWALAGFRTDEFAAGPHIKVTNGSKKYGILISDYALRRWSEGDVFAAVHEIAHEVVHSLDPIASYQAVNIEEGTACTFANLFHDAHAPDNAHEPCGNYLRPTLLVRRLLAYDQDAIKALRGLNPGGFRDMNASEIQVLGSDLSEAECEFLAQRFAGRGD